MKFFCPFCTNQTFSLYAAQLGIHYDEMSLSAYGSTSVRDSALKIYALEERMRKKPCTWPDSNPWHDVLITRSLPLCCNYLYVCLFLPTSAHVCPRLPTSALANGLSTKSQGGKIVSLAGRKIVANISFIGNTLSLLCLFERTILWLSW